MRKCPHCNNAMTGQGNISLEEASYARLDAYLESLNQGFVPSSRHVTLPLSLVESGIPTVIGLKGDIALGSDAFVGSGVSGGAMVAFNWYSGELSFMPNFSQYGNAGTPGGASVGGSAKALLANGATSNAALAGPANAFGGELSADVWGKVGMAGEFGWSVEDHISTSPNWTPKKDQWVIPAVDNISGQNIYYGAVGITGGSI